MPYAKSRILVLLMCLFPLHIIAADYYVSPTGSASWPNCSNINTPCGGRTAVENAIAGDTVYFRGGTYDPAADPVQEWTNRPNSDKRDRLPWNPQNSGTAGNPIIFKAYPGETPVMLDNRWSGAFGATQRNWIVWDGFSGTIVDVNGGVISLVVFWQANDSALINSDLTGVVKQSNENSALVRLERSNNILIENNSIHGMTGAVNSAGILNFYTSGMILRNNDIYNNFIGIYDKDSEQNNHYYNNHIWGGDGVNETCQTGIQINDQLDKFGLPTFDIKAYQNVVHNCEIGITIYSSNTGGSHNVGIFNNTLVAQAAGDIGILVMQGSDDADIYNNVVYGFNDLLLYFSPLNQRVRLSDNNLFFGSNMTWRINYGGSAYNSLGAWTSATSFDGNSIVSDPLLTNSNGAQASDFKLLSGSAGLGTGNTGQDIGAYPLGGITSIGSNAIRPNPPVVLN